jgi:hypothetical protein
MAQRKDWGFEETRRRGGRRRSSPSAWPWLLALAGLLLTLGATRPWPQSSGSPSSSSSDDLTTWEQLSLRFNQGLDGQSSLLQQALTELTTSEASSQKSIDLLEQSSKENALLRNYNEQMTQRARQRNEELAKANGRIDRLKLLNLRLTAALTTAVAAAAALAILLILTLRRR